MTQKEKAKAYDKALRVIKNLIDAGLVYEDAAIQIFPELKESEDEKVRKEIIAVFKGETSYTSEEDAKRYIDWLEKQGEKSLTVDIESMIEAYEQRLINQGNGVKNSPIVNMCVAAFKHGVENTLDELHLKQGETSPILSNSSNIGKDEQKPTIEMKSAEESLGIDSETYNEIVNDCIFGENKPKFKVGDWITDGYVGGQITSIEYSYPCYKIADFMGGINTSIPFSLQDNYHLWTIDDAKDGDVLAYVTDEEDLWIMIYWSLYEPYEGHVHYHALLVNDEFYDKGTCCICINYLKPATKEQRDTLFAKIKEAGYEWDAEKKELKKIEDEEYNGEDYGIDSLFHAQRILEKTLGSVDGYQTDDGILSHKCAITAVKKLYEQKPWSKEDEEHIHSLLDRLEGMCKKGSTFITTRFAVNQDIDWLKSLKQRIGWRPSEEQMKALHDLNLTGNISYAGQGQELINLYNDLKKLKGE